MAWAKRIFLFVLINFLVMGTVFILMSVFQIGPYLSEQGIDYRALLAFCLIWGMGGALVSLSLSRIMAKWMMGVKIVEPDTRDPELQEYVQMVYRLSKTAGLSVMPQVGIYQSPEVNAFATGPTKKRSLVAVSTGLLQRMNREEIEGVLGHEVAHIANGDMVTMTLVQGIVNAFVMFLARVIAFAITNLGRRDDRGEGMSYMTYHITVFVLDFVFMFLGMIVISAFSRYREFRADAGSARIAGREKMVAALESLKRTYEQVDPNANQPAFQTMKISGGNRGLARFFSTHPSLDDRIARLQRMA